MTRVHVLTKRVYDEPAPSDGTRILVDRVWPRGLSKARAHLDEWCKQIAPSPQLRTWYKHDPAKFDEFARRYRDELTEPDRAEPLARLREVATGGTLTLLTATKAIELSQAEVLRQVIDGGD